MDESNNDFWQNHSRKFLEMAFRADYHERPYRADGHGIKTGDCGDTVEFFLMVKDDRIEAISYSVNGCINTNACANAIIDLAEGKKLDETWEISPEDVADYLETLPKDHFHCAELSVGALYLALANVRQNSMEPWKKLYQ